MTATVDAYGVPEPTSHRARFRSSGVITASAISPSISCSAASVSPTAISQQAISVRCQIVRLSRARDRLCGYRGRRTGGPSSGRVIRSASAAWRIRAASAPTAAAALRGHHHLPAARALASRSDTKVAVVGSGGLSHLGVKRAKAMGAEVTVPGLSAVTTKSKRPRLPHLPANGPGSSCSAGNFHRQAACRDTCSHR